MGDSFFLRWLDDELFFSLCSRNHYFSGNLLDSSTCKSLFNSMVGGTAHDFPCNLHAFEQNNVAQLGCADSIITSHTILPFFAPFQSSETIQRAILAMKSPQVGSIKYQLGLVAGRFGAEHPLKACPDCVERDASTYGVAYWHLTHQYPGVILCPIHHQMLRECNEKRRWAGRFSWTLPCEAVLAPPPEYDISQISREALLKLANGVISLSSVGFSRTFEPASVRQVYSNELNRLNHTDGARTDWNDIANSFLEYSQALRLYRPLNSLPSNLEAAKSFIQRLIRRPRGHCHPLRHLLLITWLFADFRLFVDAYNRTVSIQQPAEQSIFCSSTPTVLLQPLPLTEPRVKGARRPKILKINTRSQILELLAHGTAKSDICSRFNITVSTVNKLLRAEPSIHAIWLAVRRKQEIFQHRNDWIALLSRASPLSAKSLRTLAPNIYAWLYRNDRGWLLAQTAGLPTGRQGNYSKINWLTRDRELERLIRTSLVAAYGTDSDISLTRAQLYALIPSLPAYLEKRDRYPNTRAFLLEIEGKALRGGGSGQRTDPGEPRDGQHECAAAHQRTPNAASAS